MKHQITHFIKTLIKDRYVAVLLAVFLVLCIAVVVFLAIRIRSSELQIVVHYTGFGSTNFYRDKWYYLLTFVAFVVVLAGIHTFVSYKLLQKRGRELALAFLWLSIALVFIAASLFYQILKIASLS